MSESCANRWNALPGSGSSYEELADLLDDVRDRIRTAETQRDDRRAEWDALEVARRELRTRVHDAINQTTKLSVAAYRHDRRRRGLPEWDDDAEPSA